MSAALDALLVFAKVYNIFSLYKSDTIYSNFTPVVKSPVIGYRISGPQTLHVLTQLVKYNFKPHPKKTVLRSIYDLSGNIIDKCNITYFKSPNSFTGEDVAEIFIHGSPVLASSLEKTLSQINLAFVRAAKNGEFSYRALINRKISLKQSQAINRIIMSDSIEEINYSKKVLFNGDQESALYDLKEKIINIYSKIITSIDFIEDENFDLETILAEIKSFFREIEKTIEQNRTIIEQKNICNVMIVGDVNVGKSTIFNKIIGMDRAIITNIKGTTRDIISEDTILSNKVFKFFDTAGYRKRQGKIELIGYKKALSLSKKIDHFLIVFNEKLLAADIAKFKKDFKINKNFTLIANKSDISNQKNRKYKNISINFNMDRNKIIKLLKLEKIHKNIIKQNKKTLTLNKSELSFLQSIFENKDYILKQNDMLIVQEIIRNIIDEFSSNFGYINNEDILDNVFSSFCIGK